MTTSVAALVETGYAAAVETAVYTAPSLVIIDRISAYGAALGTLTLRIVPAGGTAGASNTLAVKALAAGEAYSFPELVGQVLMPGDKISELASAASAVVRRISGRAVT